MPTLDEQARDHEEIRDLREQLDWSKALGREAGIRLQARNTEIACLRRDVDVWRRHAECLREVNSDLEHEARALRADCDQLRRASQAWQRGYHAVLKHRDDLLAERDRGDRQDNCV